MTEMERSPPIWRPSSLTNGTPTPMTRQEEAQGQGLASPPQEFWATSQRGQGARGIMGWQAENKHEGGGWHSRDCGGYKHRCRSCELTHLEERGTLRPRQPLPSGRVPGCHRTSERRGENPPSIPTHPPAAPPPPPPEKKKKKKKTAHSTRIVRGYAVTCNKQTTGRFFFSFFFFRLKKKSFSFFLAFGV